MIEITPLHINDIPAAAALFAAEFGELRQATPALPGTMEDRSRISAYLERILTRSDGLGAWESGRLVGYLAWFLIDDLRSTGRKSAYVPEWGHAAQAGNTAPVYRALYRAAGEAWARAGCQVHAITLLAHNELARETWFWNGFGLTVVDAVRLVQPLPETPHPALTIRPAGPADAQALYDLDIEHCLHYTQPPVFMPPRQPEQPAGWQAFLSQPNAGVWLALDGDQPAGFMRFDPSGEASTVVESLYTININGAYVRPVYRGRQAAPALLDAALRHYAGRGFSCCAVDFESFNPEAAAFWLKYFQPVCYSLIRVPESVLISVL